MPEKTRPSVYEFCTCQHLPFLVLLLLLSFASCQRHDTAETMETSAANQNGQTEIDSVRLAARRPAPEFYILTPEIHKNRVYICDDLYADVFHTQYDCEVFKQCPESTPKRNVSLLNAIREYGRYNCQTCCPELSHIFDEKMVR